MLIVRLLAVVFGVALLLFGAGDLLLPHARFVSSNPPPISIVAQSPSSVTVSFSNKLAPESTIDVTSTIRLSPSGEIEYLKGDSVVIRSGIDSSDPSGNSMRAELPPSHKGLYWINWTTTTAGWRTVTYGKTAFGVGMGVPESLVRDFNGSIWERTYDWRRRRAAMVGGVIMIALGIFLPFFSQNFRSRL